MSGNIQERIEQWEKMTREVPDDMSWYSLAEAYREADRLADAERAYGEAIACNANLSKAYQVRGQVLIQLGKNDEAAKVLTAGFTIAAQRGDGMPMRAMEELLKSINAPLPQVAQKGPVAPAVDPKDPNTIVDRRSGKPGTRFDRPPMRGPVGEFIAAHYSKETWQEWIRQGTKVINELRLDFSRADHQRVYDNYMMEWLGFTQADADAMGKK
ncbi:MAG: Fe(2+)-trafficking protein [Phycisphaeraceae bacterium]